jgi:hypothetical protein
MKKETSNEARNPWVVAEGSLDLVFFDDLKSSKITRY